MPQPLSALERRILDYLVDYVRHHTFQPSIREIGARFEIKSTKTVSEHLQALAEKGWIRRDSARSRGVRLLGLDLTADVVSVSHIDVHLSEPSLEDPLDSFTLDRRLAGTAGSFLVSMSDDTMIRAGIREGDMLLIEPMPEEDIEDGELVLVRYDGETNVRELVRKRGETVLKAASRGLAPVSVSPSVPLAVLGRVSAVIRQLAEPLEPETSRELKGKGAVAT